MGASLDTLLPARVEFSDGWQTVNAVPLSNSATADNNGNFWVVRQSPRLLAWYSKYHVSDIQVEVDGQSSPAVVALAAELDTIGREEAEHLFKGRSVVPEIGNVILRDFSKAQQGAYTSTAHRDLDDVAVSNLTARHARVFLNFWVPLTPVKQDHLGLCLPESVDLSKDPGGFKGMEGDRTGIHNREGHRWVYVPDLLPGDVLIWRSEVVYHASLMPAQASGPVLGSTSSHHCIDRRKSLDLRLIYFEDLS